MLNIYSVFADDDVLSSTANNMLLINSEHIIGDDTNLNVQSSPTRALSPYLDSDNSTILPPSTLEEELLLSVNVSTITMSAETEMFSYRTGEFGPPPITSTM